MRIAVIPARGCSKRIPRKNIKEFCGKPMIAWSIEAAIKSNCFERIVCSTDDEEIAAVANKYGAETPFLRPASLCDDYTATIPVIAHAIETLQQEKGSIDLVCCIYATAPFITPNDIKLGLEKLLAENADYCFSVTSYPYPIQRSFRITKNNRCEMFQPEMFEKRSQDLEEAYHDAGQFYWGRSNAWLEEKQIFSHNTTPYILPRCRVQDIDTPEDWDRAEKMFETFEKNGEADHDVATPSLSCSNSLGIQPNTPIYRIIPTSHFIEILNKRCLTLTHPSKWDDPFENALLSAKIMYGIEVGNLDPIRKCVFGQSWSLCVESDAMWRIYSPKKDSVKIKTTAHKLLNALISSNCNHPELYCFIGVVEYESGKNVWSKINGISDLLTSDGKGIARTLLIKRDEFQHEKEVRLVFTNGPESLFHDFKIDPNVLIEEVILDPRSTDLELLNLQEQARQLCYSGDVSRSDLYKPPDQIIFDLK